MKALTYSNVMATVAVFVALSGTSYAAVKITGKDVKNGSLAGRDVKNGSLSGGDVRTGSLGTRDVRDGSLRAADFKAGRASRRAPGSEGRQGRLRPAAGSCSTRTATSPSSPVASP